MPRRTCASRRSWSTPARSRRCPSTWPASGTRWSRSSSARRPFFLATEVDDDRQVHLFFDVPAEAPTTRGFAGILREGLEGATADEVLGTPDDFYDELGLSEVISSLRLRGMSAILFRLKRQVRDQLAA